MSAIEGGTIINETLLAIIRTCPRRYIEVYRTDGLSIVWRAPILGDVSCSERMNVSVTNVGLYVGHFVQNRYGFVIPWQNTRLCADLALLKMTTSGVDFGKVKTATLPYLLWRVERLMGVDARFWTLARVLTMLHALDPSKKDALMRHFDAAFPDADAKSIFKLTGTYCGTLVTLEEQAIGSVVVWASEHDTR